MFQFFGFRFSFFGFLLSTCDLRLSIFDFGLFFPYKVCSGGAGGGVVRLSIYSSITHSGRISALGQSLSFFDYKNGASVEVPGGAAGSVFYLFIF